MIVRSLLGGYIGAVLVTLSSLNAQPPRISSEVSPTGFEGTITDPIAYLLDYYGYEQGDTVLQIEYDLDGDGVDELFLTYDKGWRDRSGHPWIVLQRRPAGWSPVQSRQGEELYRLGQVRFRPDNFYFGVVDEFGTRGLVNYAPGGGGSGSLVISKLQNGIVSTQYIKEIEPEGKDKELHQSYFGTAAEAKQPVVKKYNVADLVAQRRPETMGTINAGPQRNVDSDRNISKDKRLATDSDSGSTVRRNAERNSPDSAYSSRKRDGASTIFVLSGATILIVAATVFWKLSRRSRKQ